jgi:drug/metabolite transporter (DMT)-like permease
VTRSRALAGYGLALTSILLWGGSFIALKIALRSLGPWEIVAGRALMGAAVLIVAAVLAGPSLGTLRPGDAVRIAILGALGIPVHLGLQAVALTMTSAVHSGWLVALIPVFTAILSAIFLGERFPALKTAGVVTGFLGALVVVGSEAGFGALALPSGQGDLLVLLSCLNWAVYTLISRDLVRRIPSLTVTVGAVASGTAMVVPAWLVLGDPIRLLDAPLEGWAALVFLGVGCTGVGYLAWTAALRRLEAGRLGSFQYVQPLVTAAAAALWLAEPVGGAVAIGGALVLLGVTLVQRGANRVGGTTSGP